MNRPSQARCAKTLKTQLAKKFGSLSSDILARLEAADADRLSEWLENIFTLTLDDLQAA